MRSWVLASACMLLVALPAAGLQLAAPAPAAAVPMQADFGNPVWDALRALGHTPAEWAVLLTSDADGNRRTDFLDLTVAAAAATGQSGTPVELLARGTPEALGRLLATHPGATPVPAADAVFLTVAIGEVEALAAPGIEQLVWEPRAYATASTNPAGGNPANMGQNAISQASSAWGSGFTGAGVRLAVIDTGADPNHEALDGGKIVSFKDCVNNQANAYDDEGHGTHVASIAAGDDGNDFKGIAPGASLAIAKVLDSSGSGSLAQFKCAVDWIVNLGGAPRADAASMSAGLGVPPLSLTTLNGGQLDLFGWDRQAEVLPNRDIPFAVAAGNWLGTGIEFLGLSESVPAGVNGVNQVSSPGFASGVLTVGAVDNFQTSGTFTAVGPGKSNHAIKPDVAAHGVQTWGALRGTVNRYEQWSGTSMATPVVGGELALLIQKNGALTHTQYENAVRDGAVQGKLWSSLAYAPDPNLVMGHGVAKAGNSLALV
jgi:subtilisin family serine protease